MVCLECILTSRARIGALIGGTIVRHSTRVYINDHLAVPLNDQTAGIGHLAQEGVLHAPLLHNRLKTLDVLGRNDRHHAFLRFRHQNFAGG